MELDELKSILNDVGSTKKNAAELEKYLHVQSSGVLSRIKRNLLYEFVFGVLLIVFATVLILLVFSNDLTKWFGLFSMAVCGGFTVYVMILYKKIRLYEKTTLPLQTSLQQVIRIMERFIRLYFQLTMLMIPAAFILAFLTSYLKAKDVYDPAPFFTAGKIAFYVGFIVIFSFLMYFFTRWYLKKLYGNHLQKLRNQLKDLQNG